ncbi:hypothetical protein [Paenibacillus naphthalenovorans]|uniref:hypothetical protein n=1 Tax=Paenibacillus naphthalenovorans TaxID=162209 RepID=UPI001C31415F|nr:hypothetical protein [Paenibacillus naphthalenovorans]
MLIAVPFDLAYQCTSVVFWRLVDGDFSLLQVMVGSCFDLLLSPPKGHLRQSFVPVRERFE